jgi:IclR family pca regulon transcriptional regulator
MKRPRHFINSLEKGLAILSTYSNQKSDFSLTEMAKRNNLTLGTAHRYLLTLKELGYVTQSAEDKKYRLTPKVLSLGFSALQSMELRARILPYMIQMTRSRGVTTQCAILIGKEIIYIERIQHSGHIALDLKVGSRLPAYCTATGKAILAFMDERERLKLIRKMDFVRMTPFTITSKETLVNDLEATRKRGYAVNNQELVIGFKAFAVPILYDGKVEASVGVSFGLHQLESGDLESVLIEEMLEIAKKVSIDRICR